MPQPHPSLATVQRAAATSMARSRARRQQPVRLAPRRARDWLTAIAVTIALGVCGWSAARAYGAEYELPIPAHSEVTATTQHAHHHRRHR